MNPHQIVALGIRLISIFIGIYSLRYLVELPASMISHDLADQVHISYVIGGACLVVAAILWFAPLFIARSILPRASIEGHLNIQAFDAARVGCGLIGLWFTVNILQAFVWLFFSHIVNSGDQSLFGSLSLDDKQRFLFYLIELVFSLLLIFKSHYFALLVVGGSPRRVQ